MMIPLSPADAIAPAFSRARTILTPPGSAPGQNAPFRFGFFFRIALVAALTNAGFFGLTAGFASQAASMASMAARGGMHRHQLLAAAPGVTAAVLAILLIAAGFGLVLSVVVGWLWCRLRFTLFELVVWRHGRVGPAWAHYGRQAWRYLALLMLISLVFLILAGVTVGPLVVHLIVTLRHLDPQQIGRDPSLVFAHVLPIYGILLLFGLAGTLTDALAQDFLLPPMAIENASLGAAIGRLARLLRDRFWDVVLYVILRFVLEMGLTGVGSLAIFLVLGILGLGGAAAGLVLYQALWHTGAAGIAAFLLYCIVAGLLLVGLYLACMVSLYGSVTTFRQSYAALYFGSHYPELGDLLEPPPAVPASAETAAEGLAEPAASAPPPSDTPPPAGEEQEPLP